MELSIPLSKKNEPLFLLFPAYSQVGSRLAMEYSDAILKFGSRCREGDYSSDGTAYFNGDERPSPSPLARIIAEPSHLPSPAQPALALNRESSSLARKRFR
jgi:hypothetical protein